jgi:hypothetical protein
LLLFRQWKKIAEGRAAQKRKPPRRTFAPNDRDLDAFIVPDDEADGDFEDFDQAIFLMYDQGPAGGRRSLRRFIS